jgi:hypothetical protein
MNGIFDKLGLRPAERRLLVAVGVVLFIVANVYLVWPHFSDWTRLREEISGLETTLTSYQNEQAMLPQYEAKEAALKGQGPKITTAEMGLALIKLVQPKADRAGIKVVQWNPSSGGSSANSDFFEEHVLRITFKDTGDEQLLKFLISLGDGDSVVRIRDLTIRPDSNQMKLSGNVTMVASYQKAQP